MVHTERADLSVTTLGFTKIKKSFQLIIKLINLSVAGNRSILRGKVKHSVLQLNEHWEDLRPI